LLIVCSTGVVPVNVFHVNIPITPFLLRSPR
jgi:hypothetical protein